MYYKYHEIGLCRDFDFDQIACLSNQIAKNCESSQYRIIYYMNWITSCLSRIVDSIHVAIEWNRNSIMPIAVFIASAPSDLFLSLLDQAT